MEKNISPQLIRKFLNKKCTPEEEKQIHNWYNAYEEEPDPLILLSDQERNELRKIIFGNVLSNLREMNQLPVKRDTSRLRRLYYATAAVAAVLLLFLGLGWLTRSVLKSPISSAIPSEVRISNVTKSLQKQTLPDGSNIWLHPNSDIRYSSDFIRSSREVHMTGEAFFEVTKDPQHPFVIYTGKVVTKVLGTSFNIRAYKNTTIEVAVVTGKVSVNTADHTDNSADSKQVLLLPDEKALFMEKDGSIKKQTIGKDAAEPVRIWQKTTVSFKNAPVHEVITTLNASFGTNIKVENTTLNSEVLTADFSNQNLPDILQMLEKSLNVKYEMSDKTILLKTAVPKP